MTNIDQHAKNAVLLILSIELLSLPVGAPLRVHFIGGVLSAAAAIWLMSRIDKGGKQ